MTQLYLVTGMGRSGTKWLARLLDIDPPCYHEKVRKVDAPIHHMLRVDPNLIPAYLEERTAAMRRVEGDWGEVSSYPRYVISEFRERFQVPVVGLVRHGYYVIRSLMRRGVYKGRKIPLLPPNEIGEGQWARCCWYWADAMRILLESDIPIFKIEDLSSDWETVEELFVALGLSEPTKTHRQRWNKIRKGRINASKRGDDPLEVVPEQFNTFSHLAGEVFNSLYGESETMELWEMGVKQKNEVFEEEERKAEERFR